MSNLFPSVHSNVSIFMANDFIDDKYILLSNSTPDNRGYSNYNFLSYSSVFLFRKTTFPSNPIVITYLLDIIISLMLSVCPFLLVIFSKFWLVVISSPFLTARRNPRVLEFWKGTMVVSFARLRVSFLYYLRFGSFQMWISPEKHVEMS